MSANPAIEFLLFLFIAAAAIAILAGRLRIPYTVALVLGGLILGSVNLPLITTLNRGERPDWLTPQVILIFFLPALLFEGSLKIQIRQLRENLAPILLFANLGVFIATLFTGVTLHWAVQLPLLVALLFGAIISATDPISVLAIFKDLAVPKRLGVIIEGESLLNDGTAVVLFEILLAGIITGDMNVTAGVEHFVVSVLGGAALGFIVGYLMSKATARIDDPQIEIMLTTIVAYGSYLLGSSLHVSGVIATVTAGLVVGNLATEAGMSARTRVALWSFWEYVSFVFNSLIFLLIGLEVRVHDLLFAWKPILLAVAAVLLGRVISIYSLAPVSSLFSEKISARWQHILVWGGLHGSLSLALALSLPVSFPHRQLLLSLTFGVVAFSIVGQGLTIKPLLGLFGISTTADDEYDRARVRHRALSDARNELRAMYTDGLLSPSVFERLKAALDARVEQAAGRIVSSDAMGSARVAQELQEARQRLVTVEKSSIERAVHGGLISAAAAAKMIEAVAGELDELTGSVNPGTEKAVKQKERSEAEQPTSTESVDRR
ncbi:MAG: Na+/H+ antiporter [Candidatus Acidiferrales bacterium]